MAETNEPITIEQVIGKTPETRQQTAIGLCRTCLDLKPTEVVFLIVSLLGILGCLGLTVERLVTLPSQSTDFVFAIILLINTLFCVYYILDGVYRERPYEVSTVVIASVILILYCAIDFAIDNKKCRPLINICTANEAIKLARLIVIGAVGPIIIALGAVISWSYIQSGNLVFRTVGANIELQRMCKIVYFSEALLKFDLQLEITMVVLILQNETGDITAIEKTILGAGIVFAVLWLLLGFVAMWLESRFLTHIFFVTSILEPIYISYKIWIVSDQLANQHNEALTTTSPTVNFGTYPLDSTMTPSQNISTSLPAPTMSPASSILEVTVYLIGIFALILRAFLVVFMVRVYRNYGKGLKEKVYGPPPALIEDADRIPITSEES